MDIRDGTARSTAVAGDEEETVLSLLELGVGRLAGSACDVFH